jgi:crossover junction endodeoxyribonuclease RuvC|tara:strand:+ start:70 stop:540 length:471 start_codon:yes stop_codon:yes gene_type:complete
MIVMSIDPGLSGAIAVFEGGALIEIIDMPTHELTRNGKAKRQISASALAGIFTQHDPRHVIVEKVSAMPGQGVTSMFSFGRSLGIIEGIIAAYNIPATYVMPSVWTKGIGRGAGKDASRARACELYPSHQKQFARVKDDGRADAVLIGTWFLKGQK